MKKLLKEIVRMYDSHTFSRSLFYILHRIVHFIERCLELVGAVDRSAFWNS